MREWRTSRDKFSMGRHTRRDWGRGRILLWVTYEGTRKWDERRDIVNSVGPYNMNISK